MKNYLYLSLFLICSIILGAFFQPSLATPITTNKVISIGISDNTFQRYYYSENTFYATDKLTIVEKNSGKIIGEFNANTPIRVTIKNNLFNVYSKELLVAQNVQAPIIIKTTSEGLIGINNLKRAGKPAMYRGFFELVKPQNKENMFLTNNILDLETYLKGVVPNEMPPRFGLEALKAQAVAARNYALRPRDKKHHEFDICDSVACQVYFGANTEAELANQAIEETTGLVAQYNDEIIIALYSSTAGGYTESYENAFLPKNPEDFEYLKAVPDNDKTKPLNNEEDALEFYKDNPETFDNESRYFRWTREWTKEELEKTLKENYPAAYNSGYAQPELKNKEDFGKLKELKVKKRGDSGKIVTLEIITDKDKYTVERELVIRRLLKKDGKALPSANIVFEQEFDENKNLIKIIGYGGGYGHGVGMSQFGAGEMAKKDYSFDEILKHYYSGIKLATVPITLTNDICQNTALINFYTTKKQGNIVVENKWDDTELKVVINGKEFKLKVEPNLSKKYNIDISQYLNIGDNNVYFFYPLDNNKSKEVKVFIELYGNKNDKERRTRERRKE